MSTMRTLAKMTAAERNLYLAATRFESAVVAHNVAPGDPFTGKELQNARDTLCTHAGNFIAEVRSTPKGR